MAIAVALAVALGLFKGEASDLDRNRAAQSEAWVRPDGKIVVRVLVPALY